MKTVAIIAEFNPFHNGHEYIIKKAKELTKADNVIVIMSGEFTQQGNIAIMDKFQRAEIAISHGADLVLELPTIYATSCAETFAKGAISILNSLNIVDYIAFGTECEDITILKSIAQKSIDNNVALNNIIKENLKDGYSYAKSKANALAKILTENEYKHIANPNNILAIEYLKNLILLNSSIKPIAIKRISANHNDQSVSLNSIFSSATSIRQCVQRGEIESISPYVPKETYKNLTCPIFNDDLYLLIRFLILNSNSLDLKNIYEVSEGLEHKIENSVLTSKTYTELLNNIKSKRYTMSRIKRILVHILLDITCNQYGLLKDVKYARVLKIKSKDILSKLSKKSTIHIISNINNNSISKLDKNILLSLNLDFKAENIYSIITNSNLNKDKTNKI